MFCDPKGLVGDPAYDAANWSLKADKLMTRHAWIDFFGVRYGHDRVAGWAAILAASNAVSFAAQGKRVDRMLAYAEIARERLDRYRCRVRRRALQRPSSWLSCSGIPNVADRFASVTTSSQRSGGHHRAATEQQRVGEAGRDLLDVVGDQHGGRRRRGPAASTAIVDTRSSRPPRSSPAAGSSSSSSSGSAIRARAIWTRLRSPSLRVPKVRSVEVQRADLGEQLAGPVVVEVVVRLAPAPDHAVRRGDDDVVHPLAARDPLGEGGAGHADPGAQLEDVDGAEHLVEDAGDARRRVDLRGRDLQQRGLAGAVRTEDHPAVLGRDPPAHPVQESGLPAPDRHLGEVQDGGHAGHPIQTPIVARGVSSPAVTTLLPHAARLAWWGTSWLRGHVVTDLLVDAVLGDDATHVVAGLPGADGTETLVAGLARLRALGATGVGAAFPAEGDPVGLGGPPAFNAEALEAAEAVVVDGTGLGLVPYRTGAAVAWRALPAERRQLPDVGEADRELRAGAGHDGGRARRPRRRPLAARGRRPADEPAAPRHRSPRPRGCPARCVDLAERGLQASGIVGARAGGRRRRAVGVRDRAAPRPPWPPSTGPVGAR